MMRVLRWALVLLGVVWGLILLAWLVLQWAILPHIDEWRPRLEAEASKGLGAPLKIGAIHVRTGGWMPTLELAEVRLLDPSGREALSLPKVTATLSARSLVTLQLRFEQLLVDGPQLEVRRDAKGHVFIAGLSVDEGQKTDAGQVEALSDWFFSQAEFAIRGGRIRWVDEMRGAAPLELADLNLVLRNSLRRHELRLDATPPPAWGERFSLRGRFHQKLLERPGELRFWSGELYADLPRTDLRELRRHVDLPFELDEGDGALRAWVDFSDGSPISATVDMGLRAVKLRVAPTEPRLELTRIEGRLQLRHERQRDRQQIALQATQLGFTGADGLQWPRSNWGLSVNLSPTAPDKLDTARLLGGEVSAERLDFALMASIAERLPIGPAPREWLRQLDPHGVVSGLSARWQGALEAPTSYRVRARLEGLAVDARPSEDLLQLGRPGLSGASIALDANEKGGTAQLQVEHGHVELPGLFEEAVVPIDELAAQLEWKLQGQPHQLEVRVAGLQLRNADLQGSFDGRWHSSATSAGWLELTGRIATVEATRVQRYLPAFLVDTRHYVRGAVLSGEARNVNVRLRGELSNFPFDSPASVKAGEQFRIAAEARGVTLAYVPPEPGQPATWPPFEQVEAGLVFERAGMQIRNGHAHAYGFELQNVNGGIKDLSSRKPVLALDGAGNGPLHELLRYVQASPVNDWTGRALAQARGTGNASLRLGIALPLTELVHATVKGSVQLSGNELRLRPDVPLLGNARAKVDFDQKGVTVSAGVAQVLGGEATFEGGTQKDGSLRFTGSGLATAEALRHAGELGVVPRIAQAATGQAAYKLQLGFTGAQMDLSVSSPLTGIALNLPAPLNKEADAVLPLSVRIAPLSGGRDELRVDLGKVIAMQYQRDVGGDTAKVLRGAVALQEPLPPLPQAGVIAKARFGQVNGDAWLAQLGSGAGSGAGGGGGGGGGGGESEALDSGYMPETVELTAQSLLLTGRSLKQLTATIGRVGYANGLNGWSLQLDAEQLAGRVELQMNRGGQLARVHSRLSRLSIPKQEVEAVTQLLDRGMETEPGHVPALDIVAEDFELRGKKLGRLEIAAQASGAARDWRLSKLAVQNADASLSASGSWSAKAGGPRRTELDWKLEVQDAGKLLQRLGMGEVLRKGRGELAGHMGWTGSPLAMDYPSLSGELKLALDAGQFLKAEPGVGRLLGVLSLQSLPRRLLFDFRDVFSEGFAFDGVTGDVAISRGAASSTNLKVRGVQAVVLIDGHTDLAAETQDLRVLVVPEINAGGASLAYAAVNPVIGLGTFLAQLLLSKPMAEAGTREFHITGTWDDPKVDKVDKVERTPEPEVNK
ncbi:MAG: TIGR02099 family protein [Paucibacter sp.]|nr:TIGR02099 family protein [Roseateles sp.]